MTIDYQAALEMEHALVSVLPKLPKAPFDSKDSARTSENPESNALTEATEAREVIQWGAESLPQTWTITEPDTEAERQAIEYAERVAAIREQGKVPSSYTAITFCEQCDSVFIFEGAPPRVTTCPWCHNRAKNLPIPSPSVTCASCRHWRRDLAEPYALVTCAHAKARYPGERTPCAYFQPSEDKQ